MQEMTFKTVGVLPVSSGRWHIREGGGHVWFVNEDPDIGAYALVNGIVVSVVDWAEEPSAPLIVPKVDA